MKKTAEFESSLWALMKRWRSVGEISALAPALIAVALERSDQSLAQGLSSEQSRQALKEQCGGPELENCLRGLTHGTLAARFDHISSLFDETRTRSHGAFWATSEAAEFCVSLVGEGDFVRCAFDLSLPVALDLAVRGSGKGRRVEFVSSSGHVRSLAVAAALLLGVDLSTPVHSPLDYKDSPRADVEIAFPPLGGRLEQPGALSSEGRHFLALPEGSSKVSWEAASLAEAAVHANRRAVVCTGAGLLFRSVGAEPMAREELIRRGQLQAVFSASGGMVYSDTMAALAIMVIGPRERTPRDRVRLIDLAADRFSEETARGRRSLRSDVDWSECLSALAWADASSGMDVSTAEIADNNYVLSIERYLAQREFSDLREFLVERKSIELGSAVKLIRPKALHKKGEGTYRVLEASPGDIGEDGYLQAPQRAAELDETGYKVARAQQLRPGDVLLSIKGTIGTVGIVPETAPGADSTEIWTAGQSLIILRSGRDTPFDAVSLYSYLSSPKVNAFIRSLAGGATIQSITAKDLQALEIAIPSDAEAEEIHRRFAEHQDWFRQIRALKQKVAESAEHSWPDSAIRGLPR